MLKHRTFNEKYFYFIYSESFTKQDVKDSDVSYSRKEFDYIEYLFVNLLDITESDIEEIDLKSKSYRSIGASTWNRKLKVVFIINSEIILNQFQVYFTYLSEKNISWEVSCLNSLEEVQQKTGYDLSIHSS